MPCLDARTSSRESIRCDTGLGETWRDWFSASQYVGIITLAVRVRGSNDENGNNLEAVSRDVVLCWSSHFRPILL
jgi:hypothetical protein